MRRIIATFVTILFLLPLTSFQAQPYKIDLLVFQDLNSIDFAALSFANNLRGAPRIFQVVITPEGQDVIIKGVVDWQSDENSGSRQLVTFTTEKFKARSFFNDEIGNSEIRIATAEGDKSLAEDLIRKGKPTGKVTINLELLDGNSNFLASAEPKVLSFLNPAQTITIFSPIEGSTYDVGNVQAQWTAVTGATSYKIRANVVPPGSPSPEDALNAGNPFINDKDVGTNLTVNLSSILDRQWVGGDQVVMAVTAVITGPGGGSTLRSPLVTFRLSQSGNSSSNVTNPDLVRLANLISGKVNQDFVNKLLNGIITPDRMHFTDENGNTLTFTEFLNLLSNWETNPQSIISIDFTGK
ncbi:MAG: hypothetical protein M1495_07960 [Bacteroidetes bacterium]|nr:hypothetical protein [Bacteroidota bacterium]